MTVKETFKTESGSINAIGSNSITRTFMVFPYTNFADADAAMITSVPVGSTYTLNAVAATFSGTRSWSRVDGQGSVWQFNLDFTSAPAGSASTISTQGNTRATTKQVWRSSPAGGWATPDGTWDAPTFADIGGDDVDVGGTPTSVVSVDRRFETTAYAAAFPYLDSLSLLVGKRNLDTYEGGTAGSILYLGFSWNFDEQSGLWAIRHQFAVDKSSYHAEQVARTDGNGEVLKLKRYDGEVATYNAAHVYWVQPFTVADFSILPDF